VLVNNQPAVGAFVLFIPKAEPDPPVHPRPRATVGEDGSFVLFTYNEEDGAPEGEYWVAIRWKVEGKDDKDRLGDRYIDPEKTKLKATVKAGKNDLPPFQLK